MEFGPLDLFFAKRLLKSAYTDQRAQFLSTLMQHTREGHLCLKTAEVPHLPTEILQSGVDLVATAPIIQQDDRYYLQRNWVLETSILQQVKRLRSIKPPLHSMVNRDNALLPNQWKAVEHAFQHALTLICGGPGTGKTYTAGFLIRLLAATSNKGKKYKIVLTAPTGKASSHLQSVLGGLDAQVEAATLHRLLKIKPGENQLFSKRKIDADLIIVDEASMIDVSLLSQLLESIGDETRLVLMGDPDQLPPIEAGSLFAEMAELFAIKLTETKRTDVAHLQEIARAINRGEFPDPPKPFDETLMPRLFEMIRISFEEPNPAACLMERNRFCVLGALRQGPFGIDALNHQIIQEMKRRIKPGQWWTVPIMITTNEPRLNLYNGTCGVLIGTGVDLRKSTAYFPEKIPYHQLPAHEIAFCFSVHKSQGSEFDHVLALFPPGSENFGREALYTAVTRAKKSVEVIAEEAVLKTMLSRTSRKISGFTDRFISNKV